jgi:hypothetical protein
MGRLASETFFGPSLAFGLRVTVGESTEGVFCRPSRLIVRPAPTSASKPVSNKIPGARALRRPV